LYKTTITWTGNTGEGTSGYKNYSRNHEIVVHGKPVLTGSSDASFRGDRSRYTPEDMLVSSLSTCHMLWYLHLCAVNGVVVSRYIDEAEGEMTENPDGSGQFTCVTLRPQVTISDALMAERAIALHQEANKMCFIARSVKFPVLHDPRPILIDVKQSPARTDFQK